MSCIANGETEAQSGVMPCKETPGVNRGAKDVPAACSQPGQGLVWVLVLGMQPMKIGVSRSRSAGPRRINLSLLTSLLGSLLLWSGDDLSDYCPLLCRQDLPWQPYTKHGHLVEQIHTEKGQHHRVCTGSHLHFEAGSSALPNTHY